MELVCARCPPSPSTGRTSGGNNPPTRPRCLTIQALFYLCSAEKNAWFFGQNFSRMIWEQKSTVWRREKKESECRGESDSLWAPDHRARVWSLPCPHLGVRHFSPRIRRCQAWWNEGRESHLLTVWIFRNSWKLQGDHKTAVSVFDFKFIFLNFTKLFTSTIESMPKKPKNVYNLGRFQWITKQEKMMENLDAPFAKSKALKICGGSCSRQG